MPDPESIPPSQPDRRAQAKERAERLPGVVAVEELSEADEADFLLFLGEEPPLRVPARAFLGMENMNNHILISQLREKYG